MTEKSAGEIEEMFGISHGRIVEIDEMMTRGEMPGEQAGPVVMGRPRKFGEHMRTVAFKETDSKVAEIDRRAKRLGMRRSDYLRALVDRDLASAQ